MTSIVDRKTKKYTCKGCSNAICSVVIKVLKGELSHMLPSRCLMSGTHPKWVESPHEKDYISPVSTEVEIRSSGDMFVVETVKDYGYGFVKRLDGKYYYKRELAESEAGRRKGELDG